MRGLKNKLLEEQNRLEAIIQFQKSQLKNVPEGTLQLSKSHGKTQYYQSGSKNKKGIYLGKGKEELIRNLAQKAYDERVLKLAEKRLSQIQKITKEYEDNEIENIYLNEHPERQKLIKPIEPVWEVRLGKWLAKEYKGKDFEEDVPVIISERGERVRSKSEKILADYFYRNEIRYKYECPIYLKGTGIVYPGERLILTYETEQTILNTGKIEQLVKRYLLE